MQSVFHGTMAILILALLASVPAGLAEDLAGPTAGVLTWFAVFALILRWATRPRPGRDAGHAIDVRAKDPGGTDTP